MVRRRKGRKGRKKRREAEVERRSSTARTESSPFLARGFSFLALFVLDSDQRPRDLELDRDGGGKRSEAGKRRDSKEPSERWRANRSARKNEIRLSVFSSPDSFKSQPFCFSGPFYSNRHLRESSKVSGDGNKKRDPGRRKGGVRKLVFFSRRCRQRRSGEFFFSSLPSSVAVEKKFRQPLFPRIHSPDNSAPTILFLRST